MKQIGIYGGSFNPIHYGHLIVAQSVLNDFNLDKIVFIPNGYNPFKENLKKKDRKNCLRMLEESISDNPRFEINTIELDQKGKKFTIDTIKELKKKEPEAKFYFIIGSDILNDLEKWYKIDELLKITDFIVVNRTNQEDIKRKIKYLNKKYKSNIKYLNIPKIEISSTLIRNKVKTKQSIKYLTPDGVINIIKKNNIYNSKRHLKKIKEIKQFLKKNLKPKRYEHSINVMNTAMKLAMKYNCDIDKAQLAGLVHDCAKYLSIDDMINLAKKEQFEIPKDFLNNPPTLHAIIGSLLANKLFGIEDQQILQAISKHTTGSKEMNKLDKIIYLADYIEPGRNGDYVDEVRKLADRDLDKAVLKSLENTCKYLKENNETINLNTIEAKENLEKQLLLK